MDKTKIIQISDIGEIITGNTPPRKNPEYYGDYTLFIKPTDISKDSKYTYNPEECYSKIGYEKYKKTLIPKGATCVVTIGSIGEKLTKAHTECFINQAMNAVIPNEKYDEDYVYYVLKYNLKQLKMFDSGTASGRENVSKSAFSNINIDVLTKKDSQIKVGKILSNYDDLIENNNKRIKILEEMAQKIYKEWFVDFKFLNHETATFKQTDLGKIPNDWEVVTIDTFCNIFTGKKNANAAVPNGKYKFYTCAPEPLLIDSYIYDGKAIIIAGNGSYTGRTLFYDGKFDLYQRTYGCTIKENQIEDYIYTLYAIIKNSLEKDISGGTHGAAVPYIVFDDIAKHQFAFNKNVFDKSSIIFKQIFKSILLLNKKNQTLKQTRDLLLPRVISGEINVENMEIV